MNNVTNVQTGASALERIRAAQGAIFDMDGTLVESQLDFALIRQTLNLPAGIGVIEAIAAMPPANQAAANAALLEIEIEAARRCELMPNAAETLGILRGAGLKMALLTRNAPEAKAIAMAKYPCLRFDLAWSREMGPLKPEPDGVLRACAALEIDPALTVCVGDYRYDLEAARAAGAISVWLGRPDRPDFSEMADFTIRDLAELPRLLGLNGDRPAPGEIRRSHS